VTTKTKRVRIDVVPHLGGLWWLVIQPRKRGIRCVRRQDAIDTGRLAARFIEATGGTAQLVVRTRRGTIATEHTYPDTTPRRKG
jgi:hypothetical protein